MRNVFALAALVLAVVLLIGARADSFSCAHSQLIENARGPAEQLHPAAIHGPDHALNECDDGCRWNGFCSNPSICHHCGVVAFTIPMPDLVIDPPGHHEYGTALLRLPRLSVSYSIIDPPRA